MQRRANLRAATIKDNAAIYKLIRNSMPYDGKFVKRYLDQYFSDSPITDNDLLLIYESNSIITGVIGFCQDHFSTEYAYNISWLTVKEGEQGPENGSIASLMMEVLIEKLKHRRAKKLFVNTVDVSNRCHGFYLKQGFQFEARLKDYYGPKEDMLVFGMNI